MGTIANTQPENQGWEITPAEPASAPIPIAVPRIQRVLIVEDQRQMRETLVRQVAGFGSATFEASTAYEALKVTQEERPDVILIDALLPQMHGFELARFIRALDPSYSPRLVIVTSIYKKVIYRNEAKLKYGIDHYLIKPVEQAALAEVLS